MNFDWVKAPKSQEEEKEQFDKLYHMLVQLSASGRQENPILQESQEHQVIQQHQERQEPVGDEFTRLKLDLLANFRGAGLGTISSLETCQGCHQSFYSAQERERHLQQTPACQEWTRRGLIPRPEWDTPFFSFLEQGVGALLTPDKECHFCRKQVKSRKGLEKHFAQTALCNRLAHDTFQGWFLSSVPVPTASASLVPAASASLVPGST